MITMDRLIILEKMSKKIFKKRIKSFRRFKKRKKKNILKVKEKNEDKIFIMQEEYHKKTIQ